MKDKTINHVSYFLLTLLFSCFIVSPVFAQSPKASGSSASFAKVQKTPESDARAKILKEFLEQYNSPLAPYADVFVREADANDLDWKLVASISGVESTFAHHLPQNSYNAWGWGVYGDNVLRFTSYEDAITTISSSLRKNYMNKWKAGNVHEIGKIYAASPTWSAKVTYFMEKMEQFERQKQTETLSLTI